MSTKDDVSRDLMTMPSGDAIRSCRPRNKAAFVAGAANIRYSTHAVSRISTVVRLWRSDRTLGLSVFLLICSRLAHQST